MSLLIGQSFRSHAILACLLGAAFSVYQKGETSESLFLLLWLHYFSVSRVFHFDLQPRRP